MNGLLAALGFLTRIPVPLRVFDDAEAKTRSLPWYPVVGIILGALLALLSWGLAGQTAWLRGALLLVAWVALTGAMHLDGLADSADAWIGGLGNRERTLEIMKDPRCGPAGVVVIVLLLLVKFAALASLSTTPWLGLLLAAVLGRAACPLAFLSLRYVRAKGLGSALVDAPRAACIWALLATALGCLVLGGWHGLGALLTALAVFALWRHACQKRLGGMTGDTCGALIELVEAAVLVGWALLA